MESISSLKQLIGYDKTLVIACHECGGSWNSAGQVFTYYCLGSMLRKEDNLQQESIRHYIEARGCTQIIVVGHYKCRVIEKILEESSVATSSSILQYNVEALLKKHARKLIRPEIASKMLIELNVVEQLKLLMKYYFIRQNLESGLLRLVGVVIDDNKAVAKEIFRNGIVYNGLIASN